MKHYLVLVFCCCAAQVSGQKFIERVYMKDSSTVYEGYIIEQTPAKNVKIYRLKEKDTLQVALIDVWKITKLNEVQKRAKPLTQAPNRYYKSVYFEYYGRTYSYSLNFDMRTERGRRNGWGINAGLGALTATGKPGTRILVPFGGNYLFGEHKEFLEVGVGAVFMFYPGGADSVWGVDSRWGVDKRKDFAYGTVAVGYRHLPKANGITWRATYSLILIRQRFEPWYGLSIGYQFW
jgi:hypothetical protein